MEIDTSKGQHVIKGGRTFLGKVFAYQERTGMSIREIMKIPYIQFVIGMLDAPAVDYDKKKDKKEITTPDTAESQASAVMSALG